MPTTTTTTAAAGKPKTKTAQTPAPTNPTRHTNSAIISSSVTQPSDSSPTLGASPTASSTPDSGSSGGLGVPAIAGIAAAGGVILLFLVSIVLCRKRRRMLYEKRDFGHDPSRDPINPNDVLPRENKPTGGNQDDSGFVSYPLAVRGAGGSDSIGEPALNQQGPSDSYESPSSNQPNRNFGPTSPGPLQPSTATNLTAAHNVRAQLPTPISTNSSPSLPDKSRSSPALTPSQRAAQQQQQQQQQYHHQHQQQQQQQQRHFQQNSGPLSPGSPRSPFQQQQVPQNRTLQDSVIVNDMGHQFVLEGGADNNRNKGPTDWQRDSYEQEGSMVQSEQSFRRTPDTNYNGAGAMTGGYPGPQQRGGPPGLNNQGSPYTSPRQGPSYPSPRQQHVQYQPPQPYSNQVNSQQHPYSPPARPGYGPGPSPPVYPNQRPVYPSNGNVRSPPMSPRGPGYSPSSSPNFRARPNPNY